MILRDYQVSGSAAIFAAWETNPSVLAVLATGLGKTVLAADVIQKMQPRRTMFIAHREELIFQAHDKITRCTGLGCEIEMADIVASTSLFHRQDVVISTVQTQSKRMTRFKPDDFGLLIVDEVHHATAKTYRTVIDHYRQNPNLKVLGLTATPDRHDEEALGQIFGSVAINYGIQEGIEDGWLVPITQKLVRIEDLDFSRVRTQCGDLNGADLATLMEAEKNLHGVASASIDLIEKRRALVFTASVKQAEMVCEIFNRHNPGCAEWICGATPKEDRRKRLENFAKGRTQIMANCSVLTEGFDDPGVEVIIMAKPTKSRSNYVQMVGRSTRPLAGVVDGLELNTREQRLAAIAASAKPACLVVDFTGNSGRHKLVSMADILGGKVSEQCRERAKQIMERKTMNVTEALLEAEDELRREKEARDLAEKARRAKFVAQATYQTKTVDPFNHSDSDVYQSAISRDGRRFSEKQSGLLRKNGCDPTALGYTQGQAIIGKILSCPSDGQTRVLFRAGYTPAELEGVDRSQASAMIEAVKRNGWRRPYAIEREVVAG